MNIFVHIIMIYDLFCNIKLRPMRKDSSWRKKLLPARDQYPECSRVGAPPHPPSAVQNLTVSEVTHFTRGDNLVVSLVAQWIDPLYSNGMLVGTEFQLGRCEEGVLVNQLWNRGYINVSV